MFLTHAGFTLLPAIVQTVAIVSIVAAQFGWTTGAIVASAVAGYTGVFAWGVRRMDKPVRNAMAAQVEAAGFLTDALGNMEAIKASVAEDRLSARYAAILETNRVRWASCHRSRLQTGLAVAAVYTLCIASVLLAGATGLATRQASTGDFVLLTAYVLQIVQPLEMAGFAVRDLAQGAAYLDKWIEVLNQPVELAGARQGLATTLPDKPPSIRFEHIVFAYNSVTPLLQGVEIDVPAGSVVAVVGRSGEGKSSLIRLLLRHYTPQHGRILVNGQPIKEVDLKQLRDATALVAQDVALFHDTLRENLLLAKPDATEADIWRALTAARLADFVIQLPEGLDTTVGERGFKLSGGERQRVGLARAFLRGSRLILLDEPTSALDAQTEQEIASDILRTREGRTTLLITHRLPLAAQADRIFVLDRGKIVEAGAHDELLRSEGAYASLWRRHAFALRAGQT